MGSVSHYCCLHCNSGGKVLQRFSAKTDPQILQGYKQRGQQTFFGQFLMVYSHFCSVQFAFRHSLKPVFPRVPRLSVAVYVVRMIIATKEALHMNSETLCSSLAFRLCISPFLPISFYRLIVFNAEGNAGA